MIKKQEYIKQSVAPCLAVVYLFFSCLYVMQCLKTSETQDYLKITHYTRVPATNNTHALNTLVKKHNMPSTGKFLSRPRVISNKKTLIAPVVVLLLSLIYFRFSGTTDKPFYAIIFKSEYYTLQAQALLQT